MTFTRQFLGSKKNKKKFDFYLQKPNEALSLHRFRNVTHDTNKHIKTFIPYQNKNIQFPS